MAEYYGSGSKLTDVFQLLLAQQEATERREGRQDETALTLLSMQMKEAESTRAVLLKEYYDKKDEIAETKKMYKKYEAMDPDLQTKGSKEIIGPIVKQQKIDMDAVTKNLDTLTEYQRELESGLTELESQAVQLRELKTDFWGINKTLQPHEYYADPTDDVEQLQEYVMKPKDEGGLGWTTTAGMDLAYAQEDTQVIQDQARARGKVAGELPTAGATGSYGSIQSIMVDKKGNIKSAKELKYVDQDKSSPTYGKEVKPSDTLVAELGHMLGVGDYDDFMNQFYVMESTSPETGREVRKFLESHPSFAKNFANLERDWTTLKALEDELAGINAPKPADIEASLAAFGEDLAGVSDKEALFGAFKEMAEGGDIPRGQQGQFFDIIEQQLGVDDAYPDYSKWLTGEEDVVYEEPETVGDKMMNAPWVRSLGWTARTINELAYNNAVNVYDVVAGPYNYLTWLMTGFNPALQGEKAIGLQQWGEWTGADENTWNLWGKAFGAGGNIFGTPEHGWRKKRVK